MEEKKTFGHVLTNTARGARVLGVFLDGAEVTRHCIEADDQEGFVVLLAVAENDHFAFPLQTRREEGRVRIEMRAE